MDKTTQDSSGDSSKDLDTAVIREAGCGVIYLVEFEDTGETGYQIGLDRTEAEKLWVILGEMLGKNQTCIPPVTPIAPLPAWMQNPVTCLPNPFQWPR